MFLIGNYTGLVASHTLTTALRNGHFCNAVALMVSRGNCGVQVTVLGRLIR